LEALGASRRPAPGGSAPGREVPVRRTVTQQRHHTQHRREGKTLPLGWPSDDHQPCARLPELRDAIAHTYAATPLTYRHYTGAPHGAAYGLLKDWRSIMASHIPARTKFDNLLLTGQNLTVHGAIGVTLSAAATCSEIVGTEYLAKKIANA